ncbi:DUF3006 domain-containing protein [Lysinibacillus telephonicus]|uniref:DUF3006 domain-containing protein n=1 Tax=Lysinibacillus telephonicus TaxID=1714840 RepID=A0A3S0JY64_9BACI|nr:DUF3006 domain-containing protein [Lysinibacillus telephonicus]RTQ94468.1 DUF3006 domain-containing protein [Lysinibacillus telephonicus]
MNFNNYTLDRFEGDYAIFLKRPEEIDQLLIHRTEIDVPVKEGDIVQITDDGEKYTFKVLKEDTKNKKASIEKMIDELKNKNKI